MRDPMRIALLTHSVNPRGGVVHTLELAEALQAAGHAVTVFAPATAGQRMFRRVNCELVLVPTAQPLPGVEAVEAMVASRIAALVAHFEALLKHRRFDLFHAQDSISGNALANLRDLGLVEGFVRTVHHLDVFDNPRLTAWQHRAFAEAQQVLCVSRVWQAFLRREHGIDAGVVHNGVDLKRYSALPQPGDARVAVRHGLRPGAAVVLAVGGVEERKNTRRLLAAFAALHAQRPDSQLVIAGGASLLDHGAYVRDFHADLAASGLRQGDGEAVVLTGPVLDADMPALFRLARVVAMPSLREGFGLVVLEALASGTPVVVSNIAPFTEYLADAPVGWADPLDVSSIAAALDAGLEAPAFEQPDVCRRFSWEASAAQHLQHYPTPFAVC